IAKIASDLAKPDGLLVVAPDAVEAFLHPLPVRHLWGVGRVTEAALQRLGYRTIGDLAAAEPVRLARHVGAAGARPPPRCAGAPSVATAARSRWVRSGRSTGTARQASSCPTCSPTRKASRAGCALMRCARAR